LREIKKSDDVFEIVHLSECTRFFLSFDLIISASGEFDGIDQIGDSVVK
jgi:hypothetical protein